MKKIFNHIKIALGLKRKPCTILSGLNFNPITVVYPQALVLGVLREERVKVWNVAVKTTEPKIFYKSHSAWMLGILIEKISVKSIIAMHEQNEAMRAVRHYEKGVKMEPFLVTK